MIGKPALAIFSSPGNCHEYINDEGTAIDKYCKYPRPANRFSLVWKQLIEKHRIFYLPPAVIEKEAWCEYGRFKTD
jgi:hypothetical protein